MRKRITPQQVWREYEKGLRYNEQIKLADTVQANEDFFIGKQWEGVKANGLPTPVFNIIKRIVLYLVATTATDNVAMGVSPLSEAYPTATEEGETTGVDVLCNVVRDQFDALMEHNKLTGLIRSFMRDAAVRGDGCIYSYFDPSAETGQPYRGTIRCELLENTRVFFGDPNVREVQAQPFLLIARRERLEDVRQEVARYGGEADLVRPESDEIGDRFDGYVDDKVTTLTRFWRGKDGMVRCLKTAKDCMIRGEWETGMGRYPLVWLSWDRVTNSYHGQAAVTGLIPNQIFINKAFAMSMISLMTTAYPKVVYDRTRVVKWSSAVGQAIGVNGDVGNVAKTLDPATISPQVGQFIQLAADMTKELMGATDAALGNVRPDNTSAILALQKSSSVPMELVKQELYQAVEDLGRIWLDQMGTYFGQRMVKVGGAPVLFDFGLLKEVPLGLKLDVGGSAYWSEIAQLQTLDNLLTGGHITITDYLERLPNGYIVGQQELIDTIRAREQGTQAPVVPTMGGDGV